MLLRLLIFIILAIVVYRALKTWFDQDAAKQRRMSGRHSGHIDDDMVQDPQCGIYFPRREGFALREQGKDLLFCSEKCKQAYIHSTRTTGGKE